MRRPWRRPRTTPAWLLRSRSSTRRACMGLRNGRDRESERKDPDYDRSYDRVSRPVIHGHIPPRVPRAASPRLHPVRSLFRSIELSLFIPSHYCIEISSLIIFSWVSGKEKTRFMLSILDLQRSTEIHQHTSTFHTEQSRRDDME
ncbi:hypothetical protein ZEAMMB73_Zm00001d013606 [Zea mays]|uniref:Uncharacterized protein n=1 Tax=Zea mays TaxID=4577 RepID=B4F9A6_MAIZE|nr:unknown [Zea mays]AQK63952.1 hypothetical protein ZEAMMB73_Zm00001d013606 [Zea mays]AQK63958.1 hypothetical protein ZEAMMB73_Zm00001d013606 [Zea mays]|eukprot:NP_001130474.1 uncharacterized protein LOC100191572 [Zea mays]